MIQYIYHEKLGCFDLPNGARALAARFSKFDNMGVILAEKGSLVGPEFVVWNFYGHDLRSTAYGYYTNDIEDAARAFKKRVSEIQRSAA